jgi:hypothetical protein
MDKTTLALWTLVGACMVIVGLCCLFGLVQIIQDGQDRNIEGGISKEPKP